jgi:hypothetical protein
MHMATNSDRRSILAIVASVLFVERFVQPRSAVDDEQQARRRKAVALEIVYQLETQRAIFGVSDRLPMI